MTASMSHGCKRAHSSVRCDGALYRTWTQLLSICLVLGFALSKSDPDPESNPVPDPDHDRTLTQISPDSLDGATLVAASTLRSCPTCNLK